MAEEAPIPPDPPVAPEVCEDVPAPAYAPSLVAYNEPQELTGS